VPDRFGGATGDRTPDLMTASHFLVLFHNIKQDVLRCSKTLCRPWPVVVCGLLL